MKARVQKVKTTKKLVADQELKVLVQRLKKRKNLLGRNWKNKEVEK